MIERLIEDTGREDDKTVSHNGYTTALYNTLTLLHRQLKSVSCSVHTFKLGHGGYEDTVDTTVCNAVD